jgi:hypothetical protein
MPEDNPHLKRILNCLESRDQEMDWALEHAQGAGVVAEAAPVPPSKDLREPWWTIGDQGQTGSCVGWASADGILRWHLVKAGRLGQDEMLSPRFEWMAAKETDDLTTAPTTFIEEEGTTIKQALEVARIYGAVSDAVLPFGSGTLFPGDAKTFYAIAAQLKITSYFNLGVDTRAWRTWIATKGPVIARVNVDASWDGATQQKPNMDTFRPDTVRGGHAVTAVGYTPERFVIRNSWGTTEWGDGGFGYASDAYVRDAFTEGYGVTA